MLTNARAQGGRLSSRRCVPVAWLVGVACGLVARGVGCRDGCKAAPSLPFVVVAMSCDGVPLPFFKKKINIPKKSYIKIYLHNVFVVALQRKNKTNV